MKKYLLLVVISLSTVLLVRCTSNNQALHKILEEMANDLSASTPVMLDPYTRFDGASVTKDNVFQYNYTILNTPDAEKMVNDMMATMETQMKEQFKTDPTLRIFTKNNVVIEYIYKNSDGNEIKTITITPNNYK